MHFSVPNNIYDLRIVEAQLGRVPRNPWRVGARCAHGYPTVIVSPSLLEDSERFPNFGYLTCPHLCTAVGTLESAGAIAAYNERLQSDERLAQNQYELEAALKAVRLDECRACGQEEDVCAEVGIAGQRTTLGVKCLHIHVAYALLGLNDGIGREVLGDIALREGCSCVEARSAVCGQAAEVLRHEMSEEA